MKEWIDWLNSFYFFQYLALIAFLVLPLTALNAILGLRARWKDWNGIRNRKAFEERQRELKGQLQNIEYYRKKPLKLYREMVEVILTVLGLILISLWFGVLAALSSLLSPLGLWLAYFFIILSGFIIYLGML